MTTKQELLKSIAELMENDEHCRMFYERYMENDNQGNTVTTLESGVKNGFITIEQALKLALIVGLQWDVKFEGTL